MGRRGGSSSKQKRPMYQSRTHVGGTTLLPAIYVSFAPFAVSFLPFVGVYARNSLSRRYITLCYTSWILSGSTTHTAPTRTSRAAPPPLFGSGLGFTLSSRSHLLCPSQQCPHPRSIPPLSPLSLPPSSVPRPPPYACMCT